MQEMQKRQIQSLGGEHPMEKEINTHSSILAWEIPWTEEPGGLQSMGSWVRNDLVAKPAPHTHSWGTVYLQHLRAQKCVRSNSKTNKTRLSGGSKAAPQPQLSTPGITKGAPFFQAEKGVWRSKGKALEGRCKEDQAMALRAEWQVWVSPPLVHSATLSHLLKFGKQVE